MMRKVIILVENYLATRKMKTGENSHPYTPMRELKRVSKK